MQSHEQQMVRAHFKIQIQCENNHRDHLNDLQNTTRKYEGRRLFLIVIFNDALQIAQCTYYYYLFFLKVCANMHVDTISLYISNLFAGHFAARWWSPQCYNAFYCLNWEFSACPLNLLVKIPFYSSSRTVVIFRCYKRFTVWLKIWKKQITINRNGFIVPEIIGILSYSTSISISDHLLRSTADWPTFDCYFCLNSIIIIDWASSRELDPFKWWIPNNSIMNEKISNGNWLN